MTIALVLIAVVIVFLVYVSARPDSFRLERSVSINAAPEKVFALINDFREWSKWSPWDKIDPELKRSFSGAAGGIGTVYEWAGNNKVGSGRMEITGAPPIRPCDASRAPQRASWSPSPCGTGYWLPVAGWPCRAPTGRRC